MFPVFSRNIVLAQINRNLTETCTITKWLDVVNSDYGNPEREVLSETLAACYLTRAASGGSQDMILDADKGRVFYMLQLAHDADIEDGDTVTVDGEDYETKRVLRAQSNNVMRQALLVKAGS